VLSARSAAQLQAVADEIRGAGGLADVVELAPHGVRVNTTIPGFIAAGSDVLVTGTHADTARRLPLAQRLGLRTGDLESEPPDAVLRRHFGARRPDAWIEASGAAAALQAALTSLRPGGQVTVVGMFAQPVSLLRTELVRRELAVLTSYAASAPDCLRLPPRARPAPHRGG